MWMQPQGNVNAKIVELERRLSEAESRIKALEGKYEPNQPEEPA